MMRFAALALVLGCMVGCNEAKTTTDKTAAAVKDGADKTAAAVKDGADKTAAAVEKVETAVKENAEPVKP